MNPINKSSLEVFAPAANDANGATVTMSSREIAVLTGKRHDNVVPVCKSLRDTGVCPEIQETPYVNDQNGQTYTQFLLNKRDSFVLVARLSPEFTAKLVDRWQELEAKAAPRLPTTIELAQMVIVSETKRIAAEAQRDQAIATKAMIGNKREATAMATASAAKREVKKLEAELDRSKHYATVKRVEQAFPSRKFAWRALKRTSEEVGKSSVDVFDQNYGSVKSYHADVWLKAFDIDIGKLE